MYSTARVKTVSILNCLKAFNHAILAIMAIVNLCSGDDDSLLHDHDGGVHPRLSPAWNPVAPSL